MKKYNNIFVKYVANPDLPYSIAHKTGLNNLTEIRTRKFELDEYEQAWTFLMECM